MVSPNPTLVASRSGVVDWSDGATVSMTTLNPVEDDDVFPAASSCTAETDHVPSASAPSVQLPLDVDTVSEIVQLTVDSFALAALTVTVPPVSAALTEIVGVESLVMLSVDDEPRSDAVVRSGRPGADGPVVSGPYAASKSPGFWCGRYATTTLVPMAAGSADQLPPRFVLLDVVASQLSVGRSAQRSAPDDE